MTGQTKNPYGGHQEEDRDVAWSWSGTARASHWGRAQPQEATWVQPPESPPPTEGGDVKNKQQKNKEGLSLTAEFDSSGLNQRISRLVGRYEQETTTFATVTVSFQTKVVL